MLQKLFSMNVSPVKNEPAIKWNGMASNRLLAQNFFLFKAMNQQIIESIVKLYEKFITIDPKNSQEKGFKIQIDFDTIFSILRNNRNQQEQRTNSGVACGIKIQKFDQSIQILNYEQPEKVEIWRKLLGKFLNQRNFHQIFKPIKKIGKGNFASVYLVIKNEDKNCYAVKAFSKQIEFADQRGKQSLQNEIKIMRCLNHNNLMKLEGVYQTDNSIYIVVQYLSGGLLYDKIKRRHQFTSEQVVQILSSLLNGVKVMHEQRIMHRDLKPENILFRQQDSFDCVIADFGLATFADVDQYIYVRCGTPGYVAPEISNLKERQTHYEPICDMFSVGVIFHLIVLGASPFSGQSCDQVLKQNRQCNIDFNNKIYSRLHPTWLDLLKKMLEKDPSKRISVNQALQHQFFTQNDMAILEQLPQSKYQQCDSPLMITKNNNRKKNLKLRDDSCLKFKMKQNISIFKEEQQSIEKINSPLRKGSGRGRMEKTSKTVTPSNFKQ